LTLSPARRDFVSLNFLAAAILALIDRSIIEHVFLNRSGSFRSGIGQ